MFEVITFPPAWVWVTSAVFVICVAYYVLMPGKPEPLPPLDKLAQIILNQNNMQVYWKVPGVTMYSIPEEGGVIHKLDPAMAQLESTILQKYIPADEMGVACGLLASESVMDWQCENGNWNGSNPTRSLWGYDCGLPQLKLELIEIDGKVGPAAFATPNEAMDFAFDLSKAIPYFWGLYQAHLAEADKLIAGNTRSDIDPRLMNRYILAAIIYKQGDTGGATIFAAGTWPAELNNFGNLVAWYSQQLGIPSLV